MPRYIDADKVMEEIASMGGHNLCEWSTLGVKALIDRQPTADVAPRAEFDEVVRKLECLLCHATGGKLSYYTYDLRTMESVVTDYVNESYTEGYEEAKAEVAREIFEKIEKHLFVIEPVEEFDGWARIQLADIMRLRKKYTEATP